MSHPLQYVPADELQRLFNDGHFFEREQAGEFDVQITRDGHPSPARSGQPKCTRSQKVEYFSYDTRARIGSLHQYRLPNGQLGGSGLPDPKALLANGILYVIDVP